MKKLLFLIICIFIASIIHGEDTMIPKTIDECYERLDDYLSPEQKNALISIQSEKEVVLFHNSIGLYIRNEWLRKPNGESLIKSINQKNRRVSIDNISGAILIGYWAYLRNEGIDIDKLLITSEIYNKSFDLPIEFPKGIVLIKETTSYTIDFEDGKQNIHHYKDTNNFHYLYSNSYGWIKLNQEDFNVFRYSDKKYEYFFDERYIIK